MANFTIYRGDSSILDVAATDYAGSPLDISGGTLLFTIKSNARQLDDDAIVRKSSEPGGGIDITDAAGGIATINLLPIDTSEVYAPADYVWDLQYVSSGAYIYTLTDGVVSIRPDVTRRSSGYA